MCKAQGGVGALPIPGQLVYSPLGGERYGQFL
jgi:hypothetical protein